MSFTCDAQALQSVQRSIPLQQHVQRSIPLQQHVHRRFRVAGAPVAAAARSEWCGGGSA
jgi:hypothetical protein